jgi:hypothetical protein
LVYGLWHCKSDDEWHVEVGVDQEQVVYNVPVELVLGVRGYDVPVAARLVLAFLLIVLVHAVQHFEGLDYLNDHAQLLPVVQRFLYVV